jgi:hypothetical protein
MSESSRVFGSYSELAAANAEPEPVANRPVAPFNCEQKEKIHNILHRSIVGTDDGVDFKLERYAGDPERPHIKPILSQEDKTTLHNRLAQEQTPFYGVVSGTSLEFSKYQGKVLQYDPGEDVVKVCDSISEASGERLPDGWDTFATLD